MINLKDGLKHMHSRDLQILLKGTSPIIIDIREQFEIEITSVPNSKIIPMLVLLNNFSDILDRNQEYYILCHTGQRSYYVTKVLTEAGYNVINVFGGISLMDEYYIQDRKSVV